MTKTNNKLKQPTKKTNYKRAEPNSLSQKKIVIKLNRKNNSTKK